jgi:Raf kinase inhibitor-like YbhB/YbcL family protein
MRLIADAFEDGGDVPRRFTCDGANVSPALHWSGAPADTRSFALLCDDPDAPSGVWRHWGVYDLPAMLTGLPESVAPDAFAQGVNDFHRVGYGGPCPPHGHGVHHYRFKLLALSADKLDLPRHPPCRDIETAARRVLLGEAVLVGCYRR